MPMSERVKRGARIKKEIVGDDSARSIIKGGELANSVDEFNFDQVCMFTAMVWDGVWGREGMERKQRSILTLGMLAGLGRLDQFGLHVRIAMKHGVTVEELREICIQITGYCGGPAGSEFMQVVRQVLHEKGHKFAPKSLDDL